MAVLTISSLSTQFVLIGVAATIGGVRIDPTGDAVQMAFVMPGVTPGNTDWKVASWEVNTVSIPTTYSVKGLVGPVGGVIALAAGSWDCWVKVSDNPETPVLRCGEIRVI